MNNNSKELEKVAEEFFDSFYNNLPARMGRYEICKAITLLAIDKILDVLTEYDKNVEKDLQTEFPNFYSHNLQNMDWDFRYWGRIRKIVENYEV